MARDVKIAHMLRTRSSAVAERPLDCVSLKPWNVRSLGITQVHWKWHHWKAWVQFFIHIPQQLWVVYLAVLTQYTIHTETARHRKAATAALCSIARLQSRGKTWSIMRRYNGNGFGWWCWLLPWQQEQLGAWWRDDAVVRADGATHQLWETANRTTGTRIFTLPRLPTARDWFGCLCLFSFVTSTKAEVMQSVLSVCLSVSICEEDNSRMRLRMSTKHRKHRQGVTVQKWLNLGVDPDPGVDRRSLFHCH